MTATEIHFRPALFRFLRDLRAHNDRDWFKANRGRYEEHVLHPAQQFISDFGPRLRRISTQFVADPRPVGGSLFRIYRDVRFSRDKSPYKTHVGIQFRHKAGKDAHAPGFYLHLAPGDVMAAAGIWHPDGATLGRIREALTKNAARWKRIHAGKRFRELFEVGGDSLKRPPRGYDEGHPLIDDLKRKDFYVFTRLSQKEATAPGFIDRIATLYRAAGSYVAFLCDATGADF